MVVSTKDVPLFFDTTQQEGTTQQFMRSMRTRLSTAGIVVLLGLLLGMPAAAQETDDAAQEAQAALRRGRYEEARRLYRPLVERGRTEHTLGFVETYLATGEYREGLDEVERYLQEAPHDPYLLHMRGRLLAAVGRYEEAETAFRQAGQQKPDLWRNVLELAELLERVGRSSEARELYIAIYRPYKRGTFRTAETLGMAAKATAKLGEFHDANSAFRTAYRADATDVENLYWWGGLFREKYNDADAQRTLEEALNVNPHWADLYVELAHAVDGFAQKEELAQEALQRNPNHVGALNVLASLRILDGLYGEAEAAVQRALEVNPSSIPTLAHLASVHHLQGDTAAFSTVEQRALEINPHAGDFYITIAENCTHRFRYPDAATFGRKAVEVEHDNWQAYATLGTALLRLGQSDLARRYLEASFDQDPFNLFVGNTLTLLDEYDDFDRFESEHFTLLIHQDESDVLGPSMLELAEESYDSLAARYPYTPGGKIRLEAYNDRDDFGVRVAGVPHLGLLGVSFGDVVALNTPAAQTDRAYNWARTLWHELAHTMAIGVSAFHVPRWFTEGLSVYEEQRARPEWGREMDLDLFTGLDQDKLLPLDKIDRGFTRPEFPGQVLLSYYHASKVIGFIVDRHGFEVIVDILGELRQGHTMATSIENVLGMDVDALDEAFRADLQRQRDRLAQVLKDLPNPLAEEEDVAALEGLTGGSGNPFFRRLQEGHELLQQERYDAAESEFKQALDIYPDYVEEGNPYEALATIYEARGERDQRIDILRQFLQVSEYGADAARTLGEIYREAGDLAAATYYLKRSLDVEPYERDTRTQLAEVYEQRGQHREAIEERRAVLALDPVDKAEAYYQLAASLYAGQQVPEAKRAVLQSLELAPGYREAQRLLLKCVEE